MTDGIWKAWEADRTHLSEYSAAHALFSHVRTIASSQVITSIGLKEESSFKTAILCISSVLKAKRSLTFYYISIIIVISCPLKIISV